jgi:transcriptional regulator with XRE-family HTH domain
MGQREVALAETALILTFGDVRVGRHQALITSRQIRAARHLLGLYQADIATATGLSLVTIKRVESEREVSVSDEAIATVRHALESAGVEFTNGDEPGVKLHRKCKQR